MLDWENVECVVYDQVLDQLEVHSYIVAWMLQRHLDKIYLGEL